jgi:hypothetical protein
MVPYVTTPQEHAALIERSRQSGATVISKDTIFSRGLAVGRVMDDEVFGMSGGIRIFPLDNNVYIHVENVSEHGSKYIQLVWFTQLVPDTACWTNGYDLSVVVDPLVKAGVFMAGGFDRNQVEKFCATHSCLSYQSDTERYHNGIRVARDRSMQVRTEDGTIWQAGVKIGTYTTKTIPNPRDPAHPSYEVVVYFMNKTKCALVKYSSGILSGGAEVKTLKDGKDHIVSSVYSDRGAEPFAQFLVRESYL